MGNDNSSGTTRDTLESLKAERADLEKTVVCVQQMTRDFDTLTERRKSFDAKRVSTHLQLKGPHLRRRVWAGILSPEGFQWHKEAIARKKVLGEQLLKDTAAFCQALVAWAEDLERRELRQKATLSPSPSVPIVTGENGLMQDEFSASRGDSNEEGMLTKARVAANQVPYEFLVSHNPFMVKLLRDNAIYVEDESFLYGVDPDLVRTIIMHESRGWGADGETIEGWLSSLHGDDGTYGYGQLGKDARAAAGLSIADAMTIRGSIKGVASWLAVAIKDLTDAGVADPTIAQISTQYNSRKQKGLVSTYGKEVGWTYGQIKNGKLGQFKP